MRTRSRKVDRGFTLVELLITLVVVAVVAAIALPSYRLIIRASRLTTQIYEFNAALNLARSEAVKRGVPVTVCPRPSEEAVACDTSDPLWEAGWIVFVDPNNNQTVDDSTEELLRASGRLASNYTLRATGTELPDYVTVDPKGIPNETGSFILCENDEISPSRAILVSIVGRISLAPDDNNNGIPENAGGTDMTDCTP